MFQMMVVQGDSGIGKSRLLDAMVVRAMDHKVRAVMIVLHMMDLNTPYYAIKNLLIELLDLEMEKPHQEREQLLYSLFEDEKIVQDLALLNQMLHLKLPLSEEQSEMNEAERKEALHGLLHRIILEVAHEMGFIMFSIDDAHYMDKESWEFIHDLAESPYSFVVLSLTSSSKNLHTSGAKQALNHPTNMVFQVEGMDPTLIAALACQLLAVSRIPAKLEDILVNRSHGIPAWCEQLLYSMLYDGFLNIEPFDPNNEGHQNLVAIPDQYKPMHRDCLSREALSDMRRMTVVNASEMTPSNSEDNTQKELICNFSPSFKQGEIRLPDSIKGMIQARIDRMEEMDQMIVKTAAVLGLSFPKKMLRSLLDKKLQRQKLNEALARLAENGIFDCAAPGQDNASTHLLPSREIERKTHNSDKKNFKYICHCPNTKPDRENTLEHCILLGFQTATIQETAYEMFTENLRRQLHVKAAEFIEFQPIKCPGCGGGPLPLISSQSAEKLREDSKEDASHHVHRSHIIQDDDMLGLSRIRRLTYRQASIGSMVFKNRDTSTMRFLKEKRHTHTELATVVRNSLLENDLQPTEQESSFMELKRGKDGKRIVDKRDCTCTMLLTKVYPEIIRHWKLAGNVEKTICAMLEGSTALLAVDDNDQAVYYLEELSDIVDAIKMGENPFVKENVNHIDDCEYDEWIEGCVESLKGQAMAHLGHREEALRHFHKALLLFDNYQPDRKSRIYMKILKEGLKQWKHHMFPSSYMGNAASYESDKLVEQARCLSHLFTDYHTHGQKSEALMSVLQQINMAEKADSDLHELIIAYTSMMECCQVRNWKSLGIKYEYKAQMRCVTSKQNIEGLVTMGHFYLTSLTMRLSWAKLEEAIESGCTGNKILQKVHDNDMRAALLPYLCYAYMLSNKVTEAVEVLESMEYVTTETDDMVGKAWFFACCLDFIMEFGLELETYSKCLVHATLCKNHPAFSRTHIPLYYLASSLSQWFQRHGVREKKELWQSVASHYKPERIQGLVAVHAFVKLLEVKLLDLAFWTQENNLFQLKRISLSIENDMKTLKIACKNLQVLQPRHFHLDAYFHMIKGNNSKAKRSLSKAKSLAKAQKNSMELKWIEQNKNMWDSNRTYGSRLRAEWISHCFDEDHYTLDWNKAKTNKTIQFILPLPRKFKKK